MLLISLLLALALTTHEVVEHEFQIVESSPSIIQIARGRPSPPRRLPPNRARPGGGLDNARQSCQADAQSLTALVPVQNPVWTTTTHPTLLFYVPDAATTIRRGQFSVFTEDEKTRIYETRFTLPQVPGIISIRLPELPEYALEEGRSYHWYFKLYCQDTRDVQVDLEQSDLSVDGWIQRVAPNAEEQAIASPDIWYDTVANVALQLQTNPQDVELQERWANLLRSIGMEELTTVPLVGSVTEEVGYQR